MDGKNPDPGGKVCQVLWETKNGRLDGHTTRGYTGDRWVQPAVLETLNPPTKARGTSVRSLPKNQAQDNHISQTKCLLRVVALFVMGGDTGWPEGKVY